MARNGHLQRACLSWAAVIFICSKASLAFSFRRSAKTPGVPNHLAGVETRKVGTDDVVKSSTWYVRKNKIWRRQFLVLDAKGSDNSAQSDAGLDDRVEVTPLDEFRSLMGGLYGVAGLAHLADCLVGPSQLLVAAGSPPYSELPPEGQAVALLWCAVGPASFAASRVRGMVADLGLMAYGLVEVGGATALSAALGSDGAMSLVARGMSPPDIDALPNAILVQAIVLVSWIYSSQKVAK